MDVKVGEVYRHFKGNVYKVIAIAKDCENLADMVVYQNVEKGDIWVRELGNFTETINRDGKNIKRFMKIQGEKI